MPDSIATQKASIRRSMRTIRRSLPPDVRSRASDAIAQHALTLPEIKNARAVLLYGASAEEVDPAPLERALRKQGVAIAYPRVAGPRTLELHWVNSPEELITGSFGLREPTRDSPLASLAEVDAIIVPGVAFDASCNRIGYGGGFYDTFLADVPHTLPTIGLAFEEQLVEGFIPCEPFDRALDVVVTPRRTVRAPV